MSTPREIAGSAAFSRRRSMDATQGARPGAGSRKRYRYQNAQPQQLIAIEKRCAPISFSLQRYDDLCERATAAFHPAEDLPHKEHQEWNWQQITQYRHCIYKRWLQSHGNSSRDCPAQFRHRHHGEEENIPIFRKNFPHDNPFRPCASGGGRPFPNMLDEQVEQKRSQNASTGAKKVNPNIRNHSTASGNK